jgi:hypothetical protein
MNKHFTVGVILMIALGAVVITLHLQIVNSTQLLPEDAAKGKASMVDIDALDRKAPLAITGENVYVAWWTNGTANNNEDVMFRASSDGGQTFGEKINLSNTTDADSVDAEIDSDADNVVVTWWERNQTSDTPLMRVSDDNGATFGPVLMLGANGTIGVATED